MTLYDIIGVKGTCQRGWLSQNPKTLYKEFVITLPFFHKKRKLI